MEEKSSGNRGGDFGGRMDEKSSGARVGSKASLTGCRMGAVYFGLSWLNMSASCSRVILVSVLNVAKRETGAGFWKICIRSLAVWMARSTEEVADIVKWRVRSTF